MQEAVRSPRPFWMIRSLCPAVALLWFPQQRLEKRWKARAIRMREVRRLGQFLMRRLQ